MESEKGTRMRLTEVSEGGGEIEGEGGGRYGREGRSEGKGEGWKEGGRDGTHIPG